jgi:hypothetical protein
MNGKNATFLGAGIAMAAAATLLVGAAGTASAREHGRGNWEELGCRSVGFLVDHDTIPVGRREGRFKAIRLEVSGNTVFMNDLKVVYANGQPDDIPVRSEIRAGGQTRPLDLKGSDRAIREVNLTYRAKPSFKGAAKVCVWGLT